MRPELGLRYDDAMGADPMDLIDDALGSAQLRGKVSARLELRAPWGARLEPSQDAGFYAIARGRGLIEAEGEAPVLMEAGELVFFGRGVRHVVRDSPSSAVGTGPELLQRCIRGDDGVLRGGGKGDVTGIIVGCFEFEAPSVERLFESLPPLLHARPSGVAAEWLESSIRLLTAEQAGPAAGSHTVLGRIADVLLIQAVRSYLQTHGANARGWLKAAIDPQLGRALLGMHERPAERWTLATLASRAAMSRSSFAERFTTIVGEPPLTYLARLRIQKGAQLLRASTRSVVEIAATVGYETEPSFRKAFRRWMGRSPAEYRRSSSGSEDASRAQ